MRAASVLWNAMYSFAIGPLDGLSSFATVGLSESVLLAAGVMDQSYGDDVYSPGVSIPS